MKRKMLSVLLSAAIVASMAGCGKSDTGATTDAAAETTTEAATDVDSEGTTDDAAVPAQFAAGWGDASQAFDPLAVEETWTFDEMRENLGAIPSTDKGIHLGATIRSVDNVYWQALSDGYEAMAEKLTAGGIATTMDIQAPMGESDTEGQLANMKDQVRQGVDLILASPISTSNCTEAVENAHRDNIPTVAVNNEFNGADMFIGPNSYDEGVVAADWADKNIGDGECAIIMGLAVSDGTLW